jgi:RND family efflux transporter MFP subunit
MNVNISNGSKVIVFLSVLLTVSCISKEQGGQKDNTAAVKILKLQKDTLTRFQEYVGTVESNSQVDVSFLVGGNIEQMYVQEGQQISEGQLLARLNTVSLKNTYDLSVATLKQAEDAYKRLSAMYENNSLPEIQYIDAKTKFEQAKSGEAIARKNLQDADLYSPQTGVVGTRYLDPGANVMPGTPVYKLMDISTVKVNIPIPEGEISGIRVGNSCRIKISALANESFQGKVIEKGVAANPVSHTYDIKVKVNNPEGRIMPGMVCRAYLSNDRDSGSGSIIVPMKSVQVAYSGKRFVWVKNKEGRAVYKEVKLGGLCENGVRIASGLEAGEELIVEGYQNISEGTLVSVKN